MPERSENRFAKFAKEYIMIFSLIGVVILGVCVSERFLSLANIANILKQSSALGVMCLGVTVATLGGKRDLSVGSIMSCAGCAAITLQDVFSPWVSLLVLILATCLMGLINGGLMVATKATTSDSFIISFGMYAVLRAFALFVSGGNNLTLDPSANAVNALYAFLGDRMVFGFLPVSFIVFILLAVVTHIFITRTKTGRNINYIGTNDRNAVLSGIKVSKINYLLYVITAACSALAGVLVIGRTFRGNSTLGINYEMDALTAIAVGGVSLYGGKGSIFHTFIGVMIITLLGNVFAMWGLDSRTQMVAKGIMIILAVCLENAKRGKSVKVK